MTTGKRLRELRKKKGLNQSEVGEIIGLSYSAISSIEQDRSEITSGALKKIADFFEVSADYLLTGKENEGTISADEQAVIELYRNDTELRSGLKTLLDVKKKVMWRINAVAHPHRHQTASA